MHGARPPINRRDVSHEWLGLREVVAYAAVSERTLRGWIQRPVDALPAVRIGGKILVRRTELDAWLGQHRVEAPKRLALDAIVKDVLRGIRRGR